MRDYIRDLVSAIIPVHNRPVMLQEAVASVLAQTYRPIEIIIVDDGSNDSTARVCDELATSQAGLVRAIHQPNSGPGLARESGRLVARGEFIQYLDSDDVLLPLKFDLQVAALRASSNCGVSYGKTRFRSSELAPDCAWKRTGEQITSMFPSFLRSRWWGTSTPLYRREVTDLAGPWSRLLYEEDWEYDCRIASQRTPLSYVADFVSEEREHSGERLSQGGHKDSTRLRHRAAAHAMILKHAFGAGIDHTFPDMQHFARELFLLSRQCGAAGLSDESKDLFILAKNASGEARARGLDFRIYEFLCGLLDWRLVGKISCFADKFRM